MNIQHKEKVVVIGSGIAGLTTASYLAKAGYDVTVIEKNATHGGRAALIREEGYMFDKGPSWYMMPDIFEHYFKLMDEKLEDYLVLKKLSPSYKVFIASDGKEYEFFSDIENLKKQFEEIEPGSSIHLDEYLLQTKRQYEIAKNEFMFKNYDSIFDFLNKRVMTEGRKLPLFSKVKKIVESKFQSEILRKVMQYQTVLLGTAPGDTPGIYALMNYVDFGLGVWYPEGGIYKIIDAMVQIAQKNGVKFMTNSPVSKILTEGVGKDKKVNGVMIQSGEIIPADIVVSGADITHTHQDLLDTKERDFSSAYWEKRTLAPSAFILYLGIDKPIENFSHHNLFFSESWDDNFKQIFKDPMWPTDPSFYICAPSKTDTTVAPAGKENLFVLVPIASGLEYTEDQLEEYGDKIIEMIETKMRVPDFKNRIEYKKVYSVKDFVKDYNAFKGTALGLAHTLGQTAIFRPNNISKKIKNLYFAGAGTNPGIGMPICIISGELVYKRIQGIKTVEPLENL